MNLLRFWSSLCAAFWVGAMPSGAANQYSVQLHIHGSLSEGVGRMVSHAALNREAGVDVLWWTDHGVTIRHPEGRELDFLQMDFEDGHVMVPPQDGLPAFGFEPVDPVDGVCEATVVDTTASGGLRSMAVISEGTADPAEAYFDGYSFLIPGDFGNRTVFQDIEVRFSARLLEPAQSNRPFAVRCRYSNDQEGRPIELVFLATAGTLPADHDHVRFHRLPVPMYDRWSEMVVPVSEMARLFDEHGYDMNYREVALGWWVTDGSAAGVLLDDFEVSFTGPESDEVLALQADFLAGLDESPIHFVGYETHGGPFKIPVNGDHLNVYAPEGVPVLPDYSDPRYSPLEYPRNVISWAHSLGYTVSYNHLFGVAGETSDGRCDTLAHRAVSNEAFGADLFEVGYRVRAGRTTEDYMKVWDQVIRRDAFVTGIGTSDAHQAHPWEIQQNRFVTWVSARRPDQATLLAGLKRGRACFGDPLVVGPQAFVSLADSAGRYVMGDVVVSEDGRATLVCEGRADLEEMRLDLITVHKVRRDTTSFIVPASEGFRVTFDVDLTNWTHVRAELRDTEYERLHLLSNPVHYRRNPPPIWKTGMSMRRVVDLRDAP